MEDNQQDPRPVRTLRQHLWNGMVSVQRRRPASFYMLLAIPVVLMLALNFLQSSEDPKRFVFGLSLLFIFLGVVLIRACRDIFSLAREHWTSQRRNFRETLGNEEFLEVLRRGNQDPKG